MSKIIRTPKLINDIDNFHKRIEERNRKNKLRYENKKSPSLRL